MQNSVERLLTGIATALRELEATDAYARGQLDAAAELLDNLAPRVQARPAPLEPLRPILEAALARAPDLPRTRAALAGDFERGEALAALAEVQAWLEAEEHPDLARAVREFIAADLERERALLRTGMFRPG